MTKTKPAKAKVAKPIQKPRPTPTKPKPKSKRKPVKPTSPPKLTDVRLSNITVDMAVQPRANGLDQGHVDEITEAIQRGAKLPAVVVFKTKAGDLILSEGFHRLEAHKRANKTHIRAEVRAGELDDARLNAMSSNQAVALRRTQADKRRAIQETLKMMPKWSDRAVAAHVGVTDKTVAEVRAGMESSAEIPHSTERTGKDGRTTKKPQPKTPKALPPKQATEPKKDDKPDQTGEQPETGAESPHPEAEKPAEPKPVQRDALGIPIQPHAAEAFEAVPLFDELVDALKKARALATQIGEHPGGALLQKRMQWMRSDNRMGGRWSFAEIDNALAAVEELTPTLTDCPYHFAEAGDHGKACPLCHGARFTGPIKHRQVPKELVKKMADSYSDSEG